ncbi:uncharacterized protein LOC121529849 [Drosophila eugracilis]|uniref:uncharacterized protein LOC121529849 n=1 Tax=Drosophila eugracilis TaxID=29029 RepID=UPI001BD94C1F|nr:uncharacterized protein LOC121529849 [Drosophila eugracilis]
MTRLSWSPRLTPTQRYNEKKMHLCLNCLRKGRSLRQCRSASCRNCHQKHHTLLHIQSNLIPTLPQPGPKKPPHSSSLVSIALPKPPSIASSPNNADYVLLATTIVYLKNRSGVFVPCRALLDSASQINFVTSRFQINCNSKSIAQSSPYQG